MLARRTIIVWVERTSLVRARVTTAGTLAHASLERMSRAPGASLAESVGAALAGGFGSRSRVWILSDELMSHTLDLDARLVRGLPADEIAAALAYEAQMLTGLSATDAALGWRSLPPDAAHSDRRAFWITQTSTREIAELERALREHGARLAGVVHPAALPRRLASTEPVNASGRADAWRRVESWPEHEAELASDAEGAVRVVVRRADPTRRRRDADHTPPSEALLAPGGERARVDTIERLLDLSRDDDVRTWLGAWADALESERTLVPAIVPEQKPMSVSTRVAVSLGLAIAASAACFVHHRKLAEERAVLARDIAIATAPAERMQSLRREIQTLEAEVAALSTETPIAPPPKPCAWSSARAAHWLRALAKHRPEGLSIDELELGPEQSSVRGQCVEPELVDRLCTELAREAAAEGCDVAPRSRSLVATPGGASIYGYEIAIRAAPACAPVSSSAAMTEQRE